MLHDFKDTRADPGVSTTLQRKLSMPYPPNIGSRAAKEEINKIGQKIEGSGRCPICKGEMYRAIRGEIICSQCATVYQKKAEQPRSRVKVKAISSRQWEESTRKRF